MISKVYFNLLFFFVLFPLLQSKSGEALAGVSVGRWARFEATVQNVKNIGILIVKWINAQNTSDRRCVGMTNNGKKLSAPDDGDDWLLFLTAEDMSSAGSLNPQ